MSVASWPYSSEPSAPEAQAADWTVRPGNEQAYPVFHNEESPPAQPNDPQISLPPEPAVPPPEPKPEPAPEAPLTGELDHQLTLLAEAFNEIAEAQNREKSRFADEVLELGLAVAEELAAGAIEVEPKRILILINEAIDLLAETRDLKIRLHPKLFERLDSLKLLEDLHLGGQVAIYPDNSIKDTGCIVESNAGRVDARIKARLSRLRHALIQEQGRTP